VAGYKIWEMTVSSAGVKMIVDCFKAAASFTEAEVDF
jgi:hypothetical protein